MSNKRIKIICIILAFSFMVCVAIFKPQDNVENIFKCITIAAGFTTALSLIYFNFLWKMKPFNELHPDILVIDGKWVATLTLEDDTTILMDIRIKQTFDNIKITMKTPIFSAKSIASTFIKEPDKLTLYYIYQTKDNKKTSPLHTPHIGTMKLQCSSTELKGFYYPDLKTSADITMIKLENEEEKKED